MGKVKQEQIEKDSRDQIIEEVRIELVRSKLKQKDLCDQTGLTYDQVNLALNGKGSKHSMKVLNSWLVEQKEKAKHRIPNWHNF